MRTTRRLGLLLVGLSIAACSDADVTPDVADAGGDTTGDTGTGDTGAGPDGDTGAPAGEPILERAGAISVACSETLRPTRPADQDWFVQATVAVGEEIWALRSGTDKLAFTRVGSDGTWGTSHALTYGRWVMAGGSGVVRGTEVTLVWGEEATEAGGQVLRHAVVDTTSGVVVAAHSIAGTSVASVSPPAFVHAGDDLFMAWGSGHQSGTANVRFARLSAAGELEGAVDLHSVAQTWNGLAPSMARAGDDFTIFWSAPNAESRYELWMMKVDDQGEVVLPARRISPAAAVGESFGAVWEAGSRPALAVGDDVWIVYGASTFNDDFVDPQGGVDLRLAVVAPSGDVTTHDVNRHVDNVSHTQASLTPMGDAVALTWVQGTTIYICAGCFVDYDIKHIVLDAETITPMSAVATHSHDEHGYRRPMPVVFGDTIVTLASQDFHALSYPAVSVMECAAVP